MEQDLETRALGSPWSLFRLQARREKKRLEYELTGSVSGRRLTVPFDKRQDLWGSAENNIRQLWIDLGIWDESWGSPWDATDDVRATRHRWGRPGPEIPHPEPFGPWQHERCRTHSPGHSPTPIKIRTGPEGLHVVQDTTSDSIEASRPYYQFIFQALRERQWLADEFDWKGTKDVDVESAAVDAVKSMWIGSGIWQGHWQEDLPGMTWEYELFISTHQSGYQDWSTTPSPSLTTSCAIKRTKGAHETTGRRRGVDRTSTGEIRPIPVGMDSASLKRWMATIPLEVSADADSDDSDSCPTVYRPGYRPPPSDNDLVDGEVIGDQVIRVGRRPSIPVVLTKEPHEIFDDKNGPDGSSWLAPPKLSSNSHGEILQDRDVEGAHLLLDPS